jgi:hypothetical protein
MLRFVCCEPAVLPQNGEPRPVQGQKLPGYPAWYRSLFSSSEGLVLTPRKTATPYLYRLEWVDQTQNLAFPLYFHDEHKWGYLVPNDGLGYDVFDKVCQIFMLLLQWSKRAKKILSGWREMACSTLLTSFTSSRIRF